jgi:hypothetical protein
MEEPRDQEDHDPERDRDGRGPNAAADGGTQLVPGFSAQHWTQDEKRTRAEVLGLLDRAIARTSRMEAA